MRLLLMQIRDHPLVLREEYESFLRYCQVDADHLDTFNVFDQPDFDAGVLDGYDALLVGGASEASVLEPRTYPFVPNCVDVLSHCIELDFPVFASCFGFQLATLALGGEIVRDSDFDLGTLPMSLRAAAAEDPLFHDIPRGFPAVSVHRERATECPRQAIELAFTERCCYAFRVRGKRFWAVQFHPEVDRETLIERLTIYKGTYTRDDEHLDQVIRDVRETPESHRLMRKFVEHIFQIA